MGHGLCSSFLNLGLKDRYRDIYTLVHTYACVCIHMYIYYVFLIYIEYIGNVSNTLFFWAQYTSHFCAQFLSDVSKGELNESY